MKYSLMLLSALAAAPLAAKGPLTVEHLNQFNKISALSLSADGRYLAYSQTNGGYAPADTSSDIYLKDLSQNSPAQRLTQTDAWLLARMVRRCILSPIAVAVIRYGACH